MQRTVSAVPAMVISAGKTSSSVARLWGKSERKRATARLARTRILPRSRERQRRLKMEGFTSPRGKDMSLETPMPTDRRAELLQLFFISATGVEHIEKKYVDGSFCGGKGEVGEDSGRHRRHCGKLVGDRASDVLFEVLNPLRDVLLQQGEVRGFEVVDGVLMLVGDDNVDDNELGCGMQRRD